MSRLLEIIFASIARTLHGIRLYTMDAFLGNNDFVKMELKTLGTVFSNVFLCSLHIINGSLKFGMYSG